MELLRTVTVIGNVTDWMKGPRFSQMACVLEKNTTLIPMTKPTLSRHAQTRIFVNARVSFSYATHTHSLCLSHFLSIKGIGFSQRNHSLNCLDFSYRMNWFIAKETAFCHLKAMAIFAQPLQGGKKSASKGNKRRVSRICALISLRQTSDNVTNLTRLKNSTQHPYFIDLRRSDTY